MEGEKAEKKMIKMIWKRISFTITKLVIWPFSHFRNLFNENIQFKYQILLYQNSIIYNKCSNNNIYSNNFMAKSLAH